MKKMMKILSALLAVLFCCSALAVIGSAEGKAGDVAQGDTFLFGNYPQSEVTDKATLTMLNASGKKVVVTDEATYRSLRMMDVLQPGDVTLSSIYGYNIKETYWFKCDPIAWRVLDEDENGNVLLMSELVLDAQAFNKPVAATNPWETSSVRTWLNDTFLNTAFSTTEQGFIQSRTNKNAVSHPIIKGDSGADTVDRVFLPSFNEITNRDYGFNKDWTGYGDFGEYTGYYDLDAARQATSSDYANCAGVWTNTNESNTEPANEFRRYWLRSAGSDSIGNAHNEYASAVLEDGRVTKGWKVDTNMVGIRPMILVSPDAVAVRDTSSPVTPPDAVTLTITMPDDTLRYRQTGVRPVTNEDVIWSTSDPSIADFDADGNLIIKGVGTVTITATLKSDPSVSTSKTLEVKYTWWQQLIRIFLFGWIWY